MRPPRAAAAAAAALPAVRSFLLRRIPVASSSSRVAVLRVAVRRDGRRRGAALARRLEVASGEPRANPKRRRRRRGRGRGRRRRSCLRFLRLAAAPALSRRRRRGVVGVGGLGRRSLGGSFTRGIVGGTGIRLRLRIRRELGVRDDDLQLQNGHLRRVRRRGFFFVFFLDGGRGLGVRARLCARVTRRGLGGFFFRRRVGVCVSRGGAGAAVPRCRAAVVVRRAHAVEVAQARERGEDERSVPGNERDGVSGEAEGPEGGHRRERLERVREGLEGVVREVEGDEGGLRGDLRGRERRDAAVREPEVEQRRGFERGRRVGDVVDRGVDRAEALAPGQVRGEAEEAVRREHERLEARERGEADVGEARSPPG